MISYLLESLLYSGLFYLSYRLLFRQLSFFRFNRVLLLLIPILSFGLPALARRFSAPPLMQKLSLLQLPLLEVAPVPDSGSVLAPQTFNFLWPYLAVCSILFLFLLLGWYKALKYIRHGRSFEGKVLLSDQAPDPFTFFQRIVIPTRLKDHPGLQGIIAHEKAHLRQWHSFDNVYYGLICCLAWVNPFFHLLFAELRQLHECEADAAALGQQRRETYARLLLSSAFGEERFSFSASPFFNSRSLKTRISMMYRKKNHSKMKALYLSLLPLMAVMFMISCNKQAESSPIAEEEVQNEVAAVSLGDVEQPPLLEGCDANAPAEEQQICFQQGLMRIFSENFEYPQSALDAQLDGKLMVQFTIDIEGNIRNIKLLKADFAEDAAQEAIEESFRHAEQSLLNLNGAIREPAIKDGQKVAIAMILPVRMKLS